MPVRNPDTVRAWIAYLHDTNGLTYRQIAEKPYFSKPPSMPPGTICAIEKGLSMPKKYRRSRGIPEMVLAPVCPIHGKACVLDCTTEKPVPLDARVIQPGKPRKRNRAEIYAGTPTEKIIQDLLRVTGKMFECVE